MRSILYWTFLVVATIPFLVLSLVEAASGGLGERLVEAEEAIARWSVEVKT